MEGSPAHKRTSPPRGVVTEPFEPDAMDAVASPIDMLASRTLKAQDALETVAGYCGSGSGGKAQRATSARTPSLQYMKTDTWGRIVPALRQQMHFVPSRDQGGHKALGVQLGTSGG